MTVTGESDEDLMMRYGRGDAAAFETLYRRHEMRVWRYLERNVGNRAAADDLMQEVWFAVARDAARYSPTARFTTWLFTIAHNRMIDHFRASGHLTVVSADDEVHEEAVIALPGARSMQPESRAENRELRERLRAAVAALPPAQREAFLLQQEAEMSLAEIAAVTGAGVETVKSRLRYALSKLRSELADLDEDLQEGLR